MEKVDERLMIIILDRMRKKAQEIRKNLFTNIENNEPENNLRPHPELQGDKRTWSVEP